VTAARGERAALAAVLVGIWVVAVAIRLSIMVRGGGLSGLGAYDDGVYYAAADALVHGRLPYHDFLFIQPPLIAVVAAPFAALGAVTSDPFGFEVGRIGFIAIGGVNAVLCGAVLRRFGWSAVAVGGFGYALFHPAVYAERSLLLEPLGTLGVLLAILLLQAAPAHRRLAIAAGVAAGLATGAKIWYIVPALLLTLMARRARLRYLIGIAIGGIAIYLPFLAAAPQQMVQQVVLDQLGRGGAPGTAGTVHRLQDLLGARTTAGVPVDLIAPVLGVLAAAAVATALATPGARVLGVLAIATVVVLLASPSWFTHYTALTALPLALCTGVAVGRLSGLIAARPGKAVLVAVVVLGVLAANEANDRTRYGHRTPPGLPAAARIVPGCITGDDPGALIELDVLSRDLGDPHCAVWPDVTGWTYTKAYLDRGPNGMLVSRPLNARWQHGLVRFMESGDATIRSRHATGFSADSKRRIDAGAVLFRRGRFVIHATTGS
jgi:alpha-1,2-mannosyltransferase